MGLLEMLDEAGQARKAVRIGQVQVKQHQANAGLPAAVDVQRVAQGARLEHLDLPGIGVCMGLHQRAQAQPHQVIVIQHQQAGRAGVVWQHRR